MRRDAYVDPEAKVPPPAGPAADEARPVESRAGGALVPADALQRYLAEERERLEREGFTPSPKLIAQRLDVREKEVVEMEQRLAARDVSVDAPVGEDEDATLLDFLPSREHTADAVADKEYHQLIRETANEFQKTLEGRDLVIYERRLAPLMRDEEPVTLQEIGDEFGITRERVRQIEVRVKKRLADYMRRQIPDIRDIQFGA